MTFDSLMHKVNSAIKKARAILPGRSLPFLVHRVDWPGGKPNHHSMRDFMEGKLKASDYPRYEQQNQEALQMTELTGIRAKEYLFDADSLHEEGVQEAARHQAELDKIEFEEFEGESEGPTFPEQVPYTEEDEE